MVILTTWPFMPWTLLKFSQCFWKWDFLPRASEDFLLMGCRLSISGRWPLVQGLTSGDVQCPFALTGNNLIFYPVSQRNRLQITPPPIPVQQLCTGGFAGASTSVIGWSSFQLQDSITSQCSTTFLVAWTLIPSVVCSCVFILELRLSDSV